MADQIQHFQNRYLLGEKIGAGGMATVFKATDTRLGRTVAVKVLHPHLLDTPVCIRRFENEARMVATLNHENIVKVFDYGREKGSHFIVMELVNGTSLASLLESNTTLPSLTLYACAQQVVQGLMHAHAQGIVHRDIKPANILIDQAGRLMIADFGIAHLLDAESLTLTGTFMGSPNYISPEQAAGKAATTASDVFSIGALLYHCATGKPPFASANPMATLKMLIDTQHVPAVMAQRQNCICFSELLDGCLQKDPDQRITLVAMEKKIAECIEEAGCTVNRQYLVDAINLPKDIHTGQGLQLLNSYCAKARNSYTSGDLHRALRWYNQSQLFGLLENKDILTLTKIRRKVSAQKKMPVLVGSGMLAVFLFVGFCCFKSIFKQSHNLAVQPAAVLLDTILSPRINAATETAVISRNVVGSFIQTSQYKKNSEKLKIADSLPSKPAPAVIIAQPGILIVKTNPPWVTIATDGVKNGQTPRQGTIALVPGAHVLELSKPSFVTYRETLVVKERDTLLRTIRMQAE